jgi:hypothetical protein
MAVFVRVAAAGRPPVSQQELQRTQHNEAAPDLHTHTSARHKVILLYNVNLIYIRAFIHSFNRVGARSLACSRRPFRTRRASVIVMEV